MFGRHAHDGPHPPIEVPTDPTLEKAILAVQEEVVCYLADPQRDPQGTLLHVLEVLDQWIDASDAYDADPERGLHYDTLGQAVGERGDAPITTLVPGGEFAAEVALVRAAKDEVRQSSEANRAKLQQCADALAEQDKQHPEGPQPE